MNQEPRGTMRRIAAAARSTDSGISIIEVLVAALIFMIISIGVTQATVTSVRLAGDQKHRVTALSLAASEIDAVRSVLDPFDVDTPAPRVVTIDGTDYTITRDTSWVSASGTDIPCGGAGTQNLQLKRVNVRVTWSGQLTSTQPVSSDTVLAPVGRINDPSLGTIMISAKKADGTGAANVTATVSPVSGGAVALDTQPPDTDTSGCTYALQVTPGTYTVALSEPNYIDITQAATPDAERDGRCRVDGLRTVRLRPRRQLRGDLRPRRSGRNGVPDLDRGVVGEQLRRVLHDLEDHADRALPVVGRIHRDRGALRRADDRRRTDAGPRIPPSGWPARSTPRSSPTDRTGTRSLRHPAARPRSTSRWASSR